MKLAIHIDGLPHEEGTVYLKLVSTADEGSVAVIAVNERGEDIYDEARPGLGSWLLTLTANGTLAPSPAVFPELGFDLDHDGRISLDPYCEAQAIKHARIDGKRPILVKG